MTVGDRIRTARKAKKLSQSKLAAELHVTRQAVWQWEHNESAPDADHVSGLCKALGMSLGDFYDGPAVDRLTAKLRRLEPSQQAMLEPMIDGLLAAQEQETKRAVK